MLLKCPLPALAASARPPPGSRPRCPASHQGRNWIGQPCDTILVAVIAAIAYPAGVRLGVEWVHRHGFRGTPLPEESEPLIPESPADPGQPDA